MRETSITIKQRSLSSVSIQVRHTSDGTIVWHTRKTCRLDDPRELTISETKSLYEAVNARLGMIIDQMALF